MKVDFDRFVNHHANYYDRNFKFLDLGEDSYPPIKDRIIQRPANFKKMIELAEKISNNIRFVRVDFYEVDSRVYFGEITFFPNSGAVTFTPKQADIEIGNLLKL